MASVYAQNGDVTGFPLLFYHFKYLNNIYKLFEFTVFPDLVVLKAALQSYKDNLWLLWQNACTHPSAFL